MVSLSSTDIQNLVMIIGTSYVQEDALLYNTCGDGGLISHFTFCTFHSICHIYPSYTFVNLPSFSLYVQYSFLILSSSILSCISVIYLTLCLSPTFSSLHTPVLLHTHNSHILLSFLTQCPLVIHLLSSHAPLLPSYNGYACYSITHLDNYTITLSVLLSYIMPCHSCSTVSCFALPSSALLCTTRPFICIIRVSG